MPFQCLAWFIGSGPWSVLLLDKLSSSLAFVFLDFLGFFLWDSKHTQTVLSVHKVCRLVSTQSVLTCQLWASLGELNSCKFLVQALTVFFQQGILFLHYSKQCADMEGKYGQVQFGMLDIWSHCDILQSHLFGLFWNCLDIKHRVTYLFFWNCLGLKHQVTYLLSWNCLGVKHQVTYLLFSKHTSLV